MSVWSNRWHKHKFVSFSCLMISIVHIFGLQGDWHQVALLLIRSIHSRLSASSVFCFQQVLGLICRLLSLQRFVFVVVWFHWGGLFSSDASLLSAVWLKGQAWRTLNINKWCSFKSWPFRRFFRLRFPQILNQMCVSERPEVISVCVVENIQGFPLTQHCFIYCHVLVVWQAEAHFKLLFFVCAQTKIHACSLQLSSFIF